MSQKSLCRDIVNMWRDSERICLLSVFALVIYDSVSGEVFGNLSRLASERQLRRRHRPHTTSHSTSYVTSESFLDKDDIPRLPKLFSFHALDEDVAVDLEFAVPFISVPIKKSMDASSKAFNSLVNLNTPALVVSGLFVVVGAGIGLLFNSFVGKTTGVKRESRITDVSSLLDPFKLVYKGADGEKTETAFGNLIEVIEGKFRENNIDITACIQKSICSYVQKSADRVRNGRGTGTNKIIDGLASSDWVLQYLEGTAVRDAIDTGNNLISCSYKYPTCKWSTPEKHMLDLALSFIDFSRQ